MFTKIVRTILKEALHNLPDKMFDLIEEHYGYKVKSFLGSGSYNDAYLLESGKVLKIIPYYEDFMFYEYFIQYPHKHVIPILDATSFVEWEGDPDKYYIVVTEKAENVGKYSFTETTDLGHKVNESLKNVEVVDVHRNNVGDYNGVAVIIDADLV